MTSEEREKLTQHEIMHLKCCDEYERLLCPIVIKAVDFAAACAEQAPSTEPNYVKNPIGGFVHARPSAGQQIYNAEPEPIQQPAISIGPDGFGVGDGTALAASATADASGEMSELEQACIDSKNKERASRYKVKELKSQLAGVEHILKAAETEKRDALAEVARLQEMLREASSRNVSTFGALIELTEHDIQEFKAAAAGNNFSGYYLKMKVLELALSASKFKEQLAEAVADNAAMLLDIKDLDEYWNGGTYSAPEACQHTVEVTEAILKSEHPGSALLAKLSAAEAELQKFRKLDMRQMRQKVKAQRDRADYC